MFYCNPLSCPIYKHQYVKSLIGIRVNDKRVRVTLNTRLYQTDIIKTHIKQTIQHEMCCMKY